MLLSLEDQAKVAEIRAKTEAGTATIEDTREFIKIVRQGRLTAVTASAAAKRSTAKKAIPDADELLKELEGL